MSVRPEDTDVRAMLRDWIMSLGNGVEFSDDDQLLTVGAITSMQLMDLITFIEDSWGLEVGVGNLFDGSFESIDAAAKFVAGN